MIKYNPEVAKRYREKHREEINERARKYSQENRVLVRAACMRSYHKNKGNFSQEFRDRRNKRSRAYEQAHREEVNLRSKMTCVNLADSYVRTVLKYKVKSLSEGAVVMKFPNGLLELQRVILTIKRELRGSV